MGIKSTIAALALLAGALATPVNVEEARSASLVPPSQDPFYLAPANLASYKPGQIIKSRKTPGPIGGIEQYTTSNVKGAYQLQYRTTNTIGRPSAAITTVLIPHNPDYSKVLAYEAPYDSADINCSPSYTLQQASNDTQSDTIFMALALNQGWIVTTADYEGTNAAFVAGVGSGQATLDSVRATLASHQITGVKPTAEYAIWGYSGGALASEWAMELQPLYAPELKFLGACLGGLTPNATNVLLTINSGPAVGLAFNGINGLMAAYPNVSTFLNSQLIPSMAAKFESVRTACGNSSAPNLDFQNVLSYFKDGEDVLYHPVTQTLFHWGTTMGFRNTPKLPIYAYKAIPDEVSPIADTDALVAKYCAAGARIEYIRNTEGEHVSEAVLGAGGAFAWLKQRFARASSSHHCSTQNVTVTQLSPATVKAFGLVIADALDLLLSQPLGPGSPVPSSVPSSVPSLVPSLAPRGALVV